MKRVEEIHRELSAMKPHLAETYHVAELGVFGSYARNEQSEGSDIDILVEFDDSIGLLDLVRLENELSNRLSVDVDLITRSSLKPRVEEQVADDIVFV